MAPGFSIYISCCYSIHSEMNYGHGRPQSVQSNPDGDIHTAVGALDASSVLPRKQQLTRCTKIVGNQSDVGCGIPKLHPMYRQFLASEASVRLHPPPPLHKHTHAIGRRSGTRTLGRTTSTRKSCHPSRKTASASDTTWSSRLTFGFRGVGPRSHRPSRSSVCGHLSELSATNERGSRVCVSERPACTMDAGRQVWRLFVVHEREANFRPGARSWFMRRRQITAFACCHQVYTLCDTQKAAINK